MSRQDPGAATGQQPELRDESNWCMCADPMAVHALKSDGSRGKCSRPGCGCKMHRPKWRRDSCGYCVLRPTVAGEHRDVQRICPDHGGGS